MFTEVTMKKKISLSAIVLFICVITYGQSAILKRDLEIQKTTPVLNLNGTGAVIEFYNGDINLTHSTNQLEVSGGLLKTATIKIGDVSLEIDSVSLTDDEITFYSSGSAVSPHINEDKLIDVDDVPILPILSGGEADTTGITPTKAGNIYLDSLNNNIYISISAARGGWRRINN